MAVMPADRSVGSAAPSHAGERRDDEAKSSDASSRQPSRTGEEHDVATGLRYSISLDLGGMDAIMDSLYGDEASLSQGRKGSVTGATLMFRDGPRRRHSGTLDESVGLSISASSSGSLQTNEPAAFRRSTGQGPREGKASNPQHGGSVFFHRKLEKPRRRSTIDSSTCCSLPSDGGVMDGEEPKPASYIPALQKLASDMTERPVQEHMAHHPRVYSKLEKPRRRCTIDSSSCVSLPSEKSEEHPDKSLRQSFSNVGDSHTAQRRVSWSNLKSVSVIDTDKSPDTISKLNVEWATLPSLPFAEKQRDESGKAKSNLTSSSSTPSLSSQVLQQLLQESTMTREQPQPPTSSSQLKDEVQPKTRVISLPWTDHKGNKGEYTGEVNASIQPHGTGTFRTFDGSSIFASTSNETTWENGRMTSAKVPLGSLAGSKDAWGSKASNTWYRRGSSGGSSARTGITNSSVPAPPQVSLPGYHLGHPAKRRSHMVVPANPELALQYANSLKSLDFAFVLRSNGEWTYSIVADRPFSEDGPKIRFVLDGKGSTKTIRRKYWERGIRLVNKEAIAADAVGSREAGGGEVEEEANEQSNPPTNRPISTARSLNDLLLKSETSRLSSDSNVAVMEPARGNISRKMNRLKGSDASYLSLSLTTAGGVVHKGSFHNGMGSEGFDENLRSEANPAREAAKKVDNSQRSGNTFDSNLKAILSLDYLGMLDILDDGSLSQEREHCHRRKSYHSQGSSSLMTVKEKSFHASRHNQSVLKTGRRASSGNLHMLSNLDRKENRKGNKPPRRSSTCSIASVNKYVPKSSKKYVPKSSKIDRRASSASLHKLEGLDKKKYMSRRRSSASSIGSVGSNVTSLSALFREMYSTPGGYHARAF